MMDKGKAYESLFAKVREKDDLGEISSEILSEMGFLWVGYYLVKEGNLVLGPYSGPPACELIRKGKGVCGTAWEKAETIIVPDVEEFPGHIACSSLSRSEIVVPLFSGGEVIGVLDIDSEELDTFDGVDALWLERIAGHSEKILKGKYR
ncbi:MAG: GAF domain-containing protein [Bacteroidales bacterium]|nr:GAF domain-containing protein [Bacteroidales bacterium]